MSNFDITKIRTKTSFADTLKKRKALGLNDSDSEDEKPKKRWTKKPIETEAEPQPTLIEVTKATNNTATVDDQPKEEFEANIRETEDYFAAANALLAQPVSEETQHKPKSTTSTTIAPAVSKTNGNSDSKKDIPLIELSDEEEEDVVVPDAELEDLDPELEAYLKEAGENNQRKPLKVTMRLQYLHNFTNLSAAALEITQNLMKPVKVIIMDNEQFHKVLESYCYRKGLKKADVVLTYNDDMVFLSGTPAGLGMTDIGVYNMNVYPITCYKAMLEEKERAKMERLNKYNNPDEFELEETVPPPRPPTATTTEESQEDKINLKLRGKDNRDVLLRIRPTATLASLLQYYKQFAKVTGDFNLSFEGETMDLNQTIEETELEDEDLVEVV